MKVEEWKEKLRYCWDHEKTRHRHMGNYRYFSLFMLLSLFTIYPQLLKSFWAHVDALSLHPVALYIIVIAIINTLAIGLYNIGMYFIYTKQIKFFEQFRVEPTLAWPWEQNKEEWSQFLWKTIITDTWNVYIVGIGLLFVDAMIRIDIQMKIEESPSNWTIVWQFFFCLILEEVFFYVAHRSLHHPKLYFLHKKHHEYKATIASAFVYSSATEHLTNAMASGLFYTLLSRVYPVHIFTVIVWLTFRIIESEDGHSGYDWPWAISNWIPFSSGGNYHFFHHSKNVGNYGAIIHIFDTFLGTNKDYIKYKIAQKDKREEKAA